jgi:hypothetical protein
MSIIVRKPDAGWDPSPSATGRAARRWAAGGGKDRLHPAGSPVAPKSARNLYSGMSLVSERASEACICTIFHSSSSL